VTFYQQAFGLTMRFSNDDNSYAEMETGATTLAFASNELSRSHFAEGFRENKLAELAAGIEIAFVTPDVKGAYAHAVAQGATALAAPVTKPWGQEVAYVRDLNGVLVEIASPMG
jgi:uncharacterized glyoxalase superfamily protein PhnB